MAKIDPWPNRDESCPERGVGLTHIQNGSPECVYCGVPTTGDPVRPRRRNKKKSAAAEFSDDETKKLEFLRFLYRSGRI